MLSRLVVSQYSSVMATSKEVVEGFHGVYLLVSLNPSMRKRTYIGYTVNPTRRIKQHNKGAAFGGARKTSSRGPWEMVLTIHGFPTDVAGLRFEWAWQNPQRSRRLKSLAPSRPGYGLAAKLKVMWTMLRVPPWSRLPLTIRWLSPQLVSEPPAGLAPPAHMPIVHGQVQSKSLPPSSQAPTTSEETDNCDFCKGPVTPEDLLTCLNSSCLARFHIFCLAEAFLSSDVDSQVIPVEGSCPVCDACMLWGDLVRKRKGCTIYTSNE